MMNHRSAALAQLLAPLRVEQHHRERLEDGRQGGGSGERGERLEGGVEVEGRHEPLLVVAERARDVGPVAQQATRHERREER